MPIIVPIEDNKAGLATATDAKFRAPDYSGSGLEALGAGVVQLGTSFEERRRRAAEAIAAAMLDDRHQSNIDDAAVKKAYVDYSDRSHEALHGDDGLLKQQGAVAHAAFPGLVEKLVDNHDKSLSKLDDVQRAAVAPAMNERLRSDVERAAEHVRQQGAAERKGQSEQLQKVAARDAVNHADDPDLFDHHLATGENAIHQQAKIDNLPDEMVARRVADYRSRIYADAIDALTRRVPTRAAYSNASFSGNLNDAGNSLDAASTDSQGVSASTSLANDTGAEFAYDRNLSDVTEVPDQSAAPAPSSVPVTIDARTPVGETAPNQDEQGDQRAASRSLSRWLYDATDSEAKEDRSQYDIGILSRQYETSNRGPGFISVPDPGDRGGKSYGSYQLASEKGQVAAFLASDGRKWAPEFRGLRLHGPDFDKKWKEIGGRDTAAFSRAQATFIKRQDYNPVVERIYQDTNLDLRTRSNAVRNAVFSTVTQMGPGVREGVSTERGGALLIHRAVDRTLAVSKPNDTDFDRTLVNNLYDARVEFANRIIAHNVQLSENPRTLPKVRTAALAAIRMWKSIIAHRYKDERRDALDILTQEINIDRSAP